MDVNEQLQRQRNASRLGTADKPAPEPVQEVRGDAKYRKEHAAWEKRYQQIQRDLNPPVRVIGDTQTIFKKIPGTPTRFVPSRSGGKKK